MIRPDDDSSTWRRRTRGAFMFIFYACVRHLVAMTPPLTKALAGIFRIALQENAVHARDAFLT